MKSGTFKRTVRGLETHHPERARVVIYYKGARLIGKNGSNSNLKSLFRTLAETCVFDNDRYCKYIFFDLLDMMSIIDDKDKLLGVNANEF